MAGIVGLTTEIGSRTTDGGRSWYALAGVGLTAVRWDEGLFLSGDGNQSRNVDPEGTTTISAVTSVGIGREFSAFGAIHRIELLLDRNHDAVARLDGFRLSLGRFR